MRTITREIVAAVIYSRDGKLFQVRQAQKERNVYPGLWGIVGGGIDKGETQRQALDREVIEEAGIDISQYPAELIDGSVGEAEKTLKDSGERVLCKMNFHTYKVIISDKDADSIEITLNDEHTEYRWTTPPELRELELTPPSVELFTKLGYL